jgi:hypothetical protein
MPATQVMDGLGQGSIFEVMLGINWVVKNAARLKIKARR